MEVAEYLVSMIGSGNINVVQSDVNQYEAKFLQLNCDKAKQILGWSPRWDIKKTISATADWYKGESLGKNVTEISRKQVVEYFEEII